MPWGVGTTRRGTRDAVYWELEESFAIQSRWASRLKQRTLSKQNVETNEISLFDFSTALKNHPRRT